MAGKANDQNVFMVDGGNISSDQDGNYRNYTVSSGSMATGSGGNPSGVVPTPVESVEEFRVSLNNQTADFNGAAGGSDSDGDQARHQQVPRRARMSTTSTITSVRTRGRTIAGARRSRKRTRTGLAPR